MPDAWIRFRQGVYRDLLRVRHAFNFINPQSRQLKRILTGVISALAVLWIVWAVVEDWDSKAPQTPLPENILYYAFSTIAQSAAALAAILGAWGLWRLDRLTEREHQYVEQQRQTEQELRQLRSKHRSNVRGATASTVVRRMVRPTAQSYTCQPSDSRGRAEKTRRYACYVSAQHPCHALSCYHWPSFRR